MRILQLMSLACVLILTSGCSEEKDPMLIDFGLLGHLEATGLLDHAQVHEMRGIATLRHVLRHHISGVFEDGNYLEFVANQSTKIEFPLHEQWAPVVELISSFEYAANPLPEDFPQSGMHISQTESNGCVFSIIYDPLTDHFWGFVSRTSGGQ